MYSLYKILIIVNCFLWDSFPQTSEDGNEWIWIISRIWTIERDLGVDGLCAALLKVTNGRFGTTLIDRTSVAQLQQNVDNVEQKITASVLKFNQVLAW